MADTEHGRPQDNPEVSHEHRDINVRLIVGFGLVLAVTAVVISLGLYWLLWHYERAAVRVAPEISPIEATPPMPPDTASTYFSATAWNGNKPIRLTSQGMPMIGCRMIHLFSSGLCRAQATTLIASRISSLTRSVIASQRPCFDKRFSSRWRSPHP